MKYKIIKDKLAEKDFKLEYVQTYGVLDMVQFVHPKIDGEIDVTFSCDESDIPKNILDGGEFDYETAEWLENLEVGSVAFNIDVSISYMTDGTLDINGSERENIIYIHGDDINLFGYILDLVSNPYTAFDFIKTYNYEKELFFRQIKKFLPITEKHKIPFRIVKRTGDPSTLYPSFSVEFYISDYDSLSFEFSTLSFKKEIIVGLSYGFIDEKSFLPIDCEYSVLENMVDEQIKSNKEFLELYREQRRKKA